MNRSFVQRAGRMSSAQKKAWDDWYPLFGLPSPQVHETCWDIEALFGRSAPLLLEIGFGNGDALLNFSKAHQDWNCLGVDVHRPGVGRVLQEIVALEARHVRVAACDVIPVLMHAMPAGSVDRVHVFFPDPWPKKKHHKRRLVQMGFLSLLARVVKPGGLLHLATDWADYATHMVAVCEESPLWHAVPGGLDAMAKERSSTRFEQRGVRLGYVISDFLYQRALVCAQEVSNISSFSL